MIYFNERRVRGLARENLRAKGLVPAGQSRLPSGSTVRTRGRLPPREAATKEASSKNKPKSRWSRRAAWNLSLQ